MGIVRIFRFISVGFFACLHFLTTQAQQTAEKFVQETRYLLALPDGYNQDTSKKWPLVIFLHGSGERGDDLQKVKTHGPPKLVDQGKKFPFILVSPQAELPYGWEPESLYKLIQNIKKTQRVDPQRVYLTGLSMGGFGTWALAMKHPEEFAAIAPICGGGDTTDAWKLRHIPIWCFHGAKDDVVSPKLSENLVAAAKRYNPTVRFTLYPEANHNSWDTTYGNDNLYEWMLAQKKFNYTEVNLSAAQLKAYEGKYVNADKDTVQMVVENGALVAKPSRQSHVLKAAGDDVFFLDPGMPVELRFTKKNGRVDGAILLADERVGFRRL